MELFPLYPERYKHLSDKIHEKEVLQEIEITHSNYTPTDLINHIAIGCVIKNDKNEVLLMFHKKFDKWTIPLGKVEPESNLNDTIIKEMKEELNIEVISWNEIHKFEKTYNRKFEGVFHNVVADIRIIAVVSFQGEIKNIENEKHLQLQWKPIDELQTTPTYCLSDATIEWMNLIGVKP